MNSDLSNIREKAFETWDKLRNNDKITLYFGMGSCGKASGADEIYKLALEEFNQYKKEVQPIQVGCIGPCYLEPLMDVQLPGMPRICYSNLNAKSTSNLIKKMLKNDNLVKQMAVGHFSDKQDFVEEIDKFSNHPMIKPQQRVVLRNCGLIDPENFHHYLARDGYKGLEKALQMDPQDVISEITSSGLRGRGGAGFPTGKKWQLCRDNVADQKYMICNADEGDPGAFMNRSLIEGDPHALLEGIIIASYAIGASKAIVYIRAEYPLAIKRLSTSLSDLYSANLLGDDILGSGFNLDIRIKEGAGAFVCGEETALLASIEGKRGMPRSRPPFPAQSGLYRKPTTINNVETLATVPNILREGADWYKQFGTEGSKGTKTFSLVGKVRRTGLIEVPLGITLRDIIDDIGGGTRKDFRAVQTGGPSGGCLTEEHLDLTIDYESLAQAGSIMGSGGLIVMDKDTCMVDVTRYFLNFTRQESCGKCSPCRVGTQHMFDILEKIVLGKSHPGELDKLEVIANTVQNGSLCGLGKTAPNPILTTMKYFRDEFEEHVNDKRCRAAVCKSLVEYSVIKEKCTGCQLCVSVCPTGAITGPRSEPHNLDVEKCIKCRACYEVCRYDAIAGDAIVIE